jgi:hypothetical protein
MAVRASAAPQTRPAGLVNPSSQLGGLCSSVRAYTACCLPPFRSGIFYHDEEQRAIAEARIKQVQEQIMTGQIGKNWGSNKVVASLAPAGDYYLAEVGAGITRAVPGSALCCSLQDFEVSTARTTRM